MSEPYPVGRNSVPLVQPEQLERQRDEFERAHTRLQEVIVPPGGEHMIDARGFEEVDDTTVAYLRTSTAPRTDVDALHIEDVHGVPVSEGRAYGKSLPEGTDFLLVNGPQASYGKDHPTSGVKGFAAIAQNGEAYEYGRDTDSKSDFADMGTGTSRRHFSIEEPVYGRLLVKDLGSTHGVAILKRVRTAVDGTPLRQPDAHGLSRNDLELIDRHLALVDGSEVIAERKQAARELIAQGTYRGESVDYGELAYSGADVLRARIFLADVMLRDPRTAETLIKKHIIGVHGTRSVSLPGVISSGGIFSAASLRQAEYPVLAGEHVNQYDEGQEDTSFAGLAGVQRILESYAAAHRQEQRSLPEVRQHLQGEISTLEARVSNESDPRRRTVFQAMVRDRHQALEVIHSDPDGLYSQMLQHDFPVLIGISQEGAKTHGAVRQGEDGLAEFRIQTNDGVSLQDLPVIAVPERYVSWVTDWVWHSNHNGVAVVPIEPFVDPAKMEEFKRLLAIQNQRR